MLAAEETIKILQELWKYKETDKYTEAEIRQALEMAIKALKQEPIDKSAMMHEIYMEGVNMSGEYQGCWVRFKNIEKIVDKYMAESEE